MNTNMTFEQSDYISDDIKWIKIVATPVPLNHKLVITVAGVDKDDLFIDMYSEVNGTILDIKPFIRGYSAMHEHMIHLVDYELDRNSCHRQDATLSMIPISRNELRSLMSLLHPNIDAIFYKWYGSIYHEPLERSIIGV